HSLVARRHDAGAQEAAWTAWPWASSAPAGSRRNTNALFSPWPGSMSSRCAMSTASGPKPSPAAPGRASTLTGGGVPIAGAPPRPRSHPEPAGGAPGRGLPVYLEKPIARTLEDAGAIVAAAERTGTVCAIGYQWHALDLLDDVHQLLAGQQIGLLVGTSVGP